MSTMEHIVYLIEMREATNVSHTGEWIMQLVLEVSSTYLNIKEITNMPMKVVDEIGRKRVSAIVTDSTRNTRLACEKFTTIIPTAFNLPNIAHFLNNLIKDLVRINYFKESISVV